MAKLLPSTAYNPNPTPQAGSGAYGGVPGIINLPTNIYDQVNKAIPGFNNTTNTTAGVIGSQVNGQVAPDVQNMLQQKAAAMGVGGGGGVGQTGSFTSNNYLASLGLTSMDQQDKGVGNYLKFLGGFGATQNDPNLQFQTSQQNAIDAAAPNPAAAASAQAAEFQQYMNMVKGGNNNFSGPLGPDGKRMSDQAATASMWGLN